MAISSGGGGADTPMSNINTTPLVDVMLVLLIIFLITIPVVIQTVELKLPVVPFEPTITKPENVLLAISATDEGGLNPGDAGFAGASPNGECRVYWNTTPISSDELLDRAVTKLEAEIEVLGGPAAIQSGQVKAEDLPEVHIRGDVNTPYRCIGGAIYQMQSAGFSKVGFISTPIDVDTGF